MKRETAILLREAAEKVAADHTKRKDYFTGESWKLLEIRPFTEDSAAAIYLKDGGKKAVALFELTKNHWNKEKREHEPRWFHRFPTDGQLIGMVEFPKVKFEVEKDNFPINFPDEELLF